MITLDFEGTIFDETRQRQKIRKLFAGFGLDYDSICRSFSKHNFFDLDCLKKLKINGERGKTIIKKTTEIVESGKEFIYEDAKIFLEQNKEELGLLTFGDKGFQKLKIKGAGVEKYFRKIVVTQKEKFHEREILSKTDILVENDLVVLESVIKHFKKIKPYLIDRLGIYENVPENIVKIKKLTEIRPACRRQGSNKCR